MGRITIESWKVIYHNKEFILSVNHVMWGKNSVKIVCSLRCSHSDIYLEQDLLKKASIWEESAFSDTIALDEFLSKMLGKDIIFYQKSVTLEP
jgi:hypothetical protein